MILTDPVLLQLHKVEQREEHGATLSAANGFRRRQKQSTCLKLMDRSLCLYEEHRKYQSRTPGEDEIKHVDYLVAVELIRYNRN